MRGTTIADGGYIQLGGRGLMNKSSRAVAGQGPEAERRADGTGRSTQRGGDETVADFLRTVTHDLKGPLTAIRGQAQLLQRRASRQGRDADVKAAMAIVNQAQRMATILDGLLEAVLAQDGNLTLALAPLNLVALANAAVDTARDTAPDQPLTIHALEQDLLIEGDAARLARVFGSLLDSALRRSAPARQVQVTLQRRGPEILVTIRDAGTERGLTGRGGTGGARGLRFAGAGGRPRAPAPPRRQPPAPPARHDVAGRSGRPLCRDDDLPWT